MVLWVSVGVRLGDALAFHLWWPDWLKGNVCCWVPWSLKGPLVLVRCCSWGMALWSSYMMVASRVVAGYSGWGVAVPSCKVGNCFVVG
jgi:hypothetical protein